MTPQMLDDYNLLKAYFNGNTEAFGDLVQKYQSYIRTLTYSATGDVEKSEDISQDVFVIAWRNLSQLRDYSKFKSWLYQITRHEIVKYYKRKKQDIISHAASVDTAEAVKTSQAGPVENAISRERREFIQRALNRIPSRYREPLILFYWEGRSVQQVAEMFELNEATARKRISRARGMLKADAEAMVEQTLSKASSCGKFSASVLGLIGVNHFCKTSAAAGATQITGSAAGTISGVVSMIGHSLTVKIVVVAAITVIGLGTGIYVLNQHTKNDSTGGGTLSVLPQELKSGLALYFSFDAVLDQGNPKIILDESGTANNGILTGGALSKGKFGQALECNAENKRDGVVVKDNSSLDLDAVTISAWIKTSRQDTQWERILDKGWQSAYNLCIGGESKGKMWDRQATFECANTSMISQTPVVDGQWHFVAGTYDGQTLKLYIDGRLDTQKRLEKIVPMKHNNADIHIGNLAVPEPPPHHEAYFDGLIDELRLYNRVLSDEEILTLYQYRPDN